MSASVLTILAFSTGTFLVLGLGSVVYDLFLRYPDSVRRRVAELTKDQDSPKISKRLFPGHIGASYNAESKLPSRSQRINLWLEQTGLDVTLKNLLIASALVAALVACLAWGVSQPLWVVGSASALAGAIPYLYLRSKRAARHKKLLHQLPEAFNSVARAVRSGQTVQASMQVVASDFTAPIANEFSRCCEQQNLGIRQETALRELGARSGVLDLQIFALALIVQARAGGNLIELLENLAHLVRTRIKMRNRVRALTGEGRAQAMVLVFLCSSVFVGLVVLMPDYISTLLERPTLLLATVGAQLIGLLWIRRIISVEF